jgi:hypothetical protein
VATDDPRAILKAAGVECPEVDALVVLRGEAHDTLTQARLMLAQNAAILALARLVAKYKWQRGKMVERLLDNEISHIRGRGMPSQFEVDAIAEAHRWKDAICAALDEEWEAEHHA